mmetsp:Transcript_9349/g.14013  ORF Transcript_9349/g.14013 Transcript_9349/m.14013 type:complete len:99 (+) Transcript_9349:405-701(+)
MSPSLLQRAVHCSLHLVEVRFQKRPSHRTQGVACGWQELKIRISNLPRQIFNIGFKSLAQICQNDCPLSRHPAQLNHHESHDHLWRMPSEVFAPESSS